MDATPEATSQEEVKQPATPKTLADILDNMKIS